MNILHIADLGTVSPDYTTGIAEVVFSLTSLQSKLGHNAEIGLISHNSYLESKNHIEYYSYEKFKNKIQHSQIDIVIFHSLYKYKYLKFATALKKCNIPYCIEFHGASTIQNANKGKLKKRIANFLGFNSFIKKAAALIYLSEKEKDLCVLKNLNANHILIPNGINSRNSVLEHKLKRISEERVEFIFLGRIDVFHKGLDLLCDALEILIKKDFYSKVHFSFYGTEKFGHYFTDRIPGLSQIADFKGPIFREEKFKMLENSDIYILTSRYEGMPVTILEALSCGCPCIITPQTNLMELISENHCGWITSLESNDIAASIMEAYDQFMNHRIQYVKNSIDAIKSFEWQNIIENSISQYDKVITSYNSK